MWQDNVWCLFRINLITKKQNKPMMCRVLKSRMKTCWALDLWTEFAYFFKKQTNEQKTKHVFLSQCGSQRWNVSAQSWQHATAFTLVIYLAGPNLTTSWPTLSHRAKENCNGKGYLRYIYFFCENLQVYEILYFYTRNWKNSSRMFLSINKQMINLILVWIH